MIMGQHFILGTIDSKNPLVNTVHDNSEELVVLCLDCEKLPEQEVCQAACRRRLRREVVTQVHSADKTFFSIPG